MASRTAFSPFQFPYLNGADDSIVSEAAPEIESFPNHLFKVSLKRCTAPSFRSIHMLSKYCFSTLHPTSEHP